MSQTPGESFDDVFAGFEANDAFRQADRALKPYYDLVLLIVRRRKELGLTQKDLAERVGVRQSRISKIEAAEHDIRLSTLAKIAAALEMEAAVILTPVGEQDGHSLESWDVPTTVRLEAHAVNEKREGYGSPPQKEEE